MHPPANQLPPNSYSPAWFQGFHVEISAERTALETSFIQQTCPLPDFSRVLDVCCGMGRHARALAAEGYTVTGIERDAQAVAAARTQGGGPTYLQADVRDYQPAPASLDAAVIMSQSFGYFDAAANAALLTKLAAALRPGGRLLLDLWNPDFFQPRQGQRTFLLPMGEVRETTRLEGRRLFSRLDYPGGGHDAFEFQTFSAEEMRQFAAPCGLSLLTACTDFRADAVPRPDNPRIQFVLGRS